LRVPSALLVVLVALEITLPWFIVLNQVIKPLLPWEGRNVRMFLIIMTEKYLDAKKIAVESFVKVFCSRGRGHMQL
jgi:hypothetical protein